VKQQAVGLVASDDVSIHIRLHKLLQAVGPQVLVDELVVIMRLQVATTAALLILTAAHTSIPSSDGSYNEQRYATTTCASCPDLLDIYKPCISRKHFILLPDSMLSSKKAGDPDTVKNGVPLPALPLPNHLS
jgi:hypothetical protein